MKKTSLILGIPNLSYHGLDQIWLFKTLGQLHWDLISKVPLYSGNNRLYASFFFGEVNFGQGQDLFGESDNFNIESNLCRVSRSVYQTNHSFYNDHNIGRATLESIFVKKTQDSHQLIKDTPEQTIGNDIAIASDNSLNNFKKIKNSLSQHHEFDKFIKLQYNPELYFNCVKILYFANYLNLVAQSEFLHFPEVKSPIKNIKIYFFSNVTEFEQVNGLSLKDGDVYTTMLATKDRVIATCIVDRSST
jgi:probable biosynthetic protein (TIGR04098 family)